MIEAIVLTLLAVMVGAFIGCLLMMNPLNHSAGWTPGLDAAPVEGGSMTPDEAERVVRKHKVNHPGDPSGFVSPVIFRAADTLLAENKRLREVLEEISGTLHYWTNAANAAALGEDIFGRIKSLAHAALDENEPGDYV